jgi:hypothetical protein
MFQKIGSRIQLPDWAKRDPRYKTLDLHDRLLDGTFYDHLAYAFYDETYPGGIGQSGQIIPIDERRPSAQFRLPRMVARWSARKLFAGRHRPKLKLDDAGDPAALQDLARILRQGRFVQTMSDVVLNGSVGSVAATFRVESDGDEKRVSFQVWRAKYCKPSFDPMGKLAQLRVQFTTGAANLKALGAKDLEDSAVYWFIRDYLVDKEITYKPVKKDDWNPVDGFVDPKPHNRALEEWTELTVDHKLGFVPGHWFVNLSGGCAPDGACTFGDAIPNSIELDYTLSQTGRGVRYNSAPQLVTIGQVMNSSSVTRSPVTQLEMRGGYKDEDGQTWEKGDAKLLEMTGQGTKAALELIDHLRNFALEQIAASRKDPDKMKAPLSGRAMEYLDQDSDDLIMDLRGQYGDDGALPLLKKVAIATKALGDNAAGALQMQWPRLAQPTPDEVFSLAQAFQLMLDPLQKTQPPQPGKPGKPASATSPATPGTPDQPAVDVKPEEQLITMEEARAYIRLNLDLAMLDVEQGAESEIPDDSPTPPADPTPPVPAPLSIDEPSVPGDDAPANQPGSAAGHAAPMHVGPPARVNA